MATVHQVHIVGGAGSGKTTLALFLAGELGIPTYDLDVVGYEDGAGAKRQLQEKLDDVHRIAAEPDWITEGVFLWWTEELFRRADVIVWPDVPFRVAAWRILLRHVKAELVGNNRHPGWRSLALFLRSARRYYSSHAVQPRAPDDDAAVTRDATVEALQTYGGKVIVCRRGVDGRRLIMSLRDRQGNQS